MRQWPGRHLAGVAVRLRHGQNRCLPVYLLPLWQAANWGNAAFSVSLARVGSQSVGMALRQERHRGRRHHWANKSAIEAASAGSNLRAYKLQLATLGKEG
jgi:hypothetical protein